MRKVNYLLSGEVCSGILMGDQVFPVLTGRSVLPVSQVQLLAPVTRPGKIIAVGSNYPPVVRKDTWAPPPFPILFHKSSTSLTGHGSAIILPRISQRVLYEGELAVVIRTRAKNVSIDQALHYVAGYTIANDVGASDIESRTSQWDSGKMFDTFCPLGPALVTIDEIRDPDSLSIRTTLNGQVVQDASTSEMIFNVPFLISYISQLTSLEPGDLILTGSPKRAGTSPDPRTPLAPGDTIRIEIENLGVLSNPVIEEGLENE